MHFISSLDHIHASLIPLSLRICLHLLCFFATIGVYKMYTSCQLWNTSCPALSSTTSPAYTPSIATTLYSYSRPSLL
ncbi:hypothetical protein BDZ91DRAFT_725914 [Kalaharituber pfeilii]|nr:hypothetical protein BDZ91DRAFT_725914 [Kalaharituber pfeilii]